MSRLINRLSIAKQNVSGVQWCFRQLRLICEMCKAKPICTLWLSYIPPCFDEWVENQKHQGTRWKWDGDRSLNFAMNTGTQRSLQPHFYLQEVPLRKHQEQYFLPVGRFVAGFFGRNQRINAYRFMTYRQKTWFKRVASIRIGSNGMAYTHRFKTYRFETYQLKMCRFNKYLGISYCIYMNVVVALHFAS